MKPIETLIVETMMASGIIPSCGVFQITEPLLDEYINLYGTLLGNTSKGTKTKSNRRYARKLAGLTLLKVNFNRGGTFNQMKSGLVYIIENEIYPEYYKIGMTIDLPSRLASYQTYDPLKRFRVIKYEFVLDRRLIEKKLLHHPDVMKELGEWVRREQAVEVFSKICFIPL